MKRAIYFLFAIGLTISQSSCTYEPPLVCDCAANNIREKTSKFNQELNNKCDKHFQSLSENEKQRWLKEIKACMNKDPYYQKILAEEKKKYYQSPEYLYGTWVCVMNGIGMRTKIMRGNTYFWQDDLSGYSSGTWQGTNLDLTFYDSGFPIGTGYIDKDGCLIQKIAGNKFKFKKE